MISKFPTTNRRGNIVSFDAFDNERDALLEY
jgi:hypothetical protein